MFYFCDIGVSILPSKRRGRSQDVVSEGFLLVTFGVFWIGYLDCQFKTVIEGVLRKDRGSGLAKRMKIKQFINISEVYEAFLDINTAVFVSYYHIGKWNCI